MLPSLTVSERSGMSCEGRSGDRKECYVFSLNLETVKLWMENERPHDRIGNHGASLFAWHILTNATRHSRPFSGKRIPVGDVHTASLDLPTFSWYQRQCTMFLESLFCGSKNGFGFGLLVLENCRWVVRKPVVLGEYYRESTKPCGKG